MKNIFIWIGVALIVAATVIGQFAGVSAAQWVELAGFAAGLAACVLGIVSKAEKKDWKLYASIAGIAVGTVLLIFAGLVENQVATLITAVAGIVAMLLGLLPALLAKSKSDK